MVHLTYKVMERFDPKKDYGIAIIPQVSQCLSCLEEGRIFSPKEIIKEHLADFVRSKRPNFSRTENIVSDSMTLGKKIGVIQQVKTEPMTFEEFLKLESVQYFKDQLRGFKQNHRETTNQGKIGGTQKLYLYRVWRFSNWLHGKEFEFKRMHQVDKDIFKKTTEKVVLKNIEHLLKLFQESVSSDSDYVKIIKRYLMSENHVGRRASTVTITLSAIKAYFRKNDSPVSFDFDPKVMYHVTTSEELEESALSLEDLMKFLTLGRPSVMEKAIVLCKFHRGLDNSTLADRFNFHAWKQIVDWFGTDEYERWDLTKCPVPIKLTRLKTDYTHRGFLDRDAIVALKSYLKIRFQKTGRIMRDGEPIFLNTKNVGITDHWISRLFIKLARRAGLHELLKSYELVPRSKKTSHELRDLLKSTLIASGTVDYVCELAIGHKVGDSYEKQDKLYPEKTRTEYMKASRKLNIFSNMSNNLKSMENNEELQKQIKELKLNQEKILFELQRKEQSYQELK